MNLTRFYLQFPGIRQGAITPPSTKLQGMQPFQVVSQADQRPFTRGGQQTTQGELAKAQCFLDDANDRFDRRFAQAVDGFTNVCAQLVGHAFFGRSSLGGWLRLVQKKGAPTLMMGAATGGDVGVNAACGQASDVPVENTVPFAKLDRQITPRCSSGIDDKLDGQQAHGQEAADALDKTWGAPAIANADKNAQWRIARYFLG